jgi:NADPH:quinone reductase-like Zn-dependent oxidoreductase
VKALEIQGSFGLENLTFAEQPQPEPGPGEVLVRMAAASLNYRDLLMVRGLYNPKQVLPLIPCSDGAGEVVAVGEGVSRVEIGDRVITLFSQTWLSGDPARDSLRSTLGGPLDGTLAEYRVFCEDGVVRAPEYLSDPEAATLTCAGVTAWNAITKGDLVGKDSTVLVLGTGGVAIFALQFAQLLGASVIITSSSDEKLERARELGAIAGINYRENPEWAKKIKELTDGQGVDLVVEVGGAETLPQSVLAVRAGGQISLIGNLGGGVVDLNLIPVFMRGVRIQGILVGSRDNVESMCRTIAKSRMRPVVDQVLPWTEVRQALQHLEAGRHFGKLCLRIS